VSAGHRRLGPFTVENEDLLLELLDKAEQVRDLVPACVGISLASRLEKPRSPSWPPPKRSPCLTVSSTSTAVPVLKGSKPNEFSPTTTPHFSRKSRGSHFAQATAAAGVASTPTLPILAEGTVVGSLNLYAATPQAFDGHHEAIARIFDAWAPGAVTNADLSFSTRSTAVHTPQHLRADVDLTVASALIAADRGISIDTARQHLHEAAQRAGVTEPQLARTIVELQDLHDAE
jgi:hypothetical protein